MQVMRIRQRDDRYRHKKKKKQHGSSSSHHHSQAKQLHAEPAYRRKPNPIRRYDTDVLSPVRSSSDINIRVSLKAGNISPLVFRAEMHFFSDGW